MKAKNLLYTIKGIYSFMLCILLLPGTAVQAQEPELPATADANMVLRLDATTLLLNEGDAVTQWNDESGKGHDAAIGLSNAPTYKATTFLGKPSVNFNGSGQYLEIPHSTDLDLTQLTMFVVFQGSSTLTDEYGVITSKQAGSSPWQNRNWWFTIQRQKGELWFRTSSNGQQPRNDLRHTTYNYKDDQPHLVSVTVPGNNGNSTMVVDGLQKASVLSSTPDVQVAPVRIGAGGANNVNRFFHGDIAEIIIYNRELTSEERQAVEIYLGKKWIGLYADEYFVISAFTSVGGIIVPEGDIELPAGGGTTFNITADEPFYEIADVKVDGVSVGAVSSYTFTDVQKNYTIDAYFDPVDPDIEITASAGSNGSIEPSGTILKYPGQYQTFTFTPEGNYGVSDVIINGVSQGPMSSYTFSNLLENQTIHVEFDLTGPMVHLDADAINGLENGQAITTWEDVSGYGNNASQGNNNNKPVLITDGGINGRQVVRFDGNNDFFTVPNDFSLDMDQVTLFAVYRSTYQESYPDDAIGVLTAKSRGHTNRSWWLVLNNNFEGSGNEAGIDPGALWFRSSSGGDVANNLYHNGSYNNGDAYMVSVVVPPDGNNENSKLYIDGEQKDETSSSTIDHAENQVMRVGAGTSSGGGVERYFSGDIAELIIYNRALTDEERQDVELALQAKWFGPQLPEISLWPTASDIVYGQTVGTSMLSGGTASVPGTFSFANPDEILDAGTYTVPVIFTPDDNVQWQTVEGTVDLMVNPLTIVVSADDKSKVYGENDPALTYTFDPALIGSDAFTGALSREVGENAGTYVIGQGDLALSANYILYFTSGQFLINKRPVEITADAKSKVYGEADEALTFQ
ncbi:MAG: MBG domain-containing protein, partial [Bacteroidota bacterium]